MAACNHRQLLTASQNEAGRHARPRLGEPRAAVSAASNRKKHLRPEQGGGPRADEEKDLGYFEANRGGGCHTGCDRNSAAVIKRPRHIKTPSAANYAPILRWVAAAISHAESSPSGTINEEEG